MLRKAVPLRPTPNAEGGQAGLVVDARANGAALRAALTLAAPHLRVQRLQRRGCRSTIDAVRQCHGRTTAREQLPLDGRCAVGRLPVPRQATRRQVGEHVCQALNVVGGMRLTRRLRDALVRRDARKQQRADGAGRQRVPGKGVVVAAADRLSTVSRRARARAKVCEMHRAGWVQMHRAAAVVRAEQDVGRLDVVVDEARVMELPQEA
mmetsp:Transcript_724/g.1843  ORF Transcript_724/g.1843 Transcript_724/m.1843 type:complete len:208 (-) Transcript_724:733-1356(-)